MARETNILTDRGIKTKAEYQQPGKYSDGDNLYLVVTNSGTKNWALRYVFNKRSREMGLGPYPEITLAEARELALEARRMLTKGIDPIEERRKRVKPTFAAMLDRFLKDRTGDWKHDAQRLRFRRVIELHAPKLLTKAVDVITRDDVQTAINKASGKPAVAKQLQKNIAAVLKFTKSHGFVAVNVAEWKDNLDQIMMLKVEVLNSPSMHHGDVKAFIATLRETNSIQNLQLEFLILTALRKDEVRLMTWQELDLDNAILTIPASRMKAGKEHRVPLSTRCVEILRDLRARKSVSDYVFPGKGGRKPLGHGRLAHIMRGMKLNAVPHGFRATFKTWAMETTDFDTTAVEMALAHETGNTVEKSYKRGDLLEKRTVIMQAYADAVS